MSGVTSDGDWIDEIVGRVLDATPSVGPVRLVCVDGPAGSGKTTLAGSLAQALRPTFGDVPVVHGDDLYEGWAVVADAPDRIAAFEAFGPRVAGWLLDPWSRGEPATHPVRDWYADAWGPTVSVPAAPVVILEGVATASRALRAHAAVVVWVEVEAELAIERVVARDGEGMRGEIVSWQRDEARWHELDGTRAAADVRVSGAGPS
jgi:uridine kinase